jgi:hypothetical protein
MVEEEIDFDARELCPDGACTGVLGDDGRCKLCGSAGVNASVNANVNVNVNADEDAKSDEDVDDRRLCPDGACIGLIGDDGRCKVCGRAEGDLAAS